MPQISTSPAPKPDGRQPVQVGMVAPDFALPCTITDAGNGWAKLGDHAGRWLLVIFYPRDFTFVCPTELRGFSAQIEEFSQKNCDILAMSIDTVERHYEWLETDVVVGGVGPLRFPLASDDGGAVARLYGVYDENKRVAGRGIFLIDPDGVIRYQVMHDLSVGRSAEEVLRVLDALQTQKLCPENWVLGDRTIDPTLHLERNMVLGQYRIDRKIGVGTFGWVYAATDIWLERPVALKVVAPGAPVDWSRILKEAKTMASFCHPNICQIFSVQQEGGVPFFVMEYVSGMTLHKIIRRHPMDIERIVHIARQVAEGLAASHARGIVHGDLKPANVMITRKGQAKILDFGLSFETGADLPDPAGPETEGVMEFKRKGEDVSSNLDTLPFVGQHRNVQARGTPGYIAPEGIRSSAITSASDSFVFGLILYEMVVGHRLIDAKSLTGTVRKFEQIKIHDKLGKIPVQLREIIRMLLDGRQNRRPSMREVADLMAGM